MLTYLSLALFVTMAIAVMFISFRQLRSGKSSRKKLQDLEEYERENQVHFSAKEKFRKMKK